MKWYVLVTSILLSSLSNGQVPSDWNTPAKDYPPMDKSKNPDEKFIPPIVSQDTLGICYAAAASTLLNFESCKMRNVDCKTQPDVDRISQLGIARYAVDPNDGGSPRLDKNFEKIPQGGSAAIVMDRVTRGMLSVPSEKCASLDKILSKDIIKTNLGASKAQLALWEDFKMQYLAYKKAKSDGCVECAANVYASVLNTISTNLTLEDDPQNVDRVNQARLLTAFGKDTFEEAMNTLLYPKECSEKENGIFFKWYRETQTFQFPAPDKQATAKELNDKIVSILEKRQPVILEYLCLQDCETKKPGLHAIAIVGHRKLCKNGKCRYAFKVQNSAGRRWQEMNNDGWLEGESLLKNAMPDGRIDWIGPREIPTIKFEK